VSRLVLRLGALPPAFLPLRVVLLSAPLGAALPRDCGASSVGLSRFCTDPSATAHGHVTGGPRRLSWDIKVFPNAARLSHSPLLLQLHGPHGNGAVPRLPRGLRQQPELCVDHHL